MGASRVFLDPTAGGLLGMWLIAGIPPAVATLRLERPAVGIVVWLTGPFAWIAWTLARRHDTEAKADACSEHFLSRV